MQEWDEVLRTALLGTERQASQSAPAVLADLPEGDPESRLLAAAGVLTVYRRAGGLPQTDTEASGQPAPDAGKDLPRVTAPATSHLAMLLDETANDLLTEWLNLCAAAGKRVPEEHLPALLERGQRHRDLRASIAQVVGLRGGWLAAQREEWLYASRAEGAGAGRGDDLWETGGFEARLAYLRELRTTAPAKARESVRKIWEQETPASRAAFLRAFDSGLSPDDEEFLETCLADKRKEVRTAAADLLVRIPGSRLVARMKERLRPLFGFEAGKQGLLKKLTGAKGQLKVSLPAACDTQMEHDGIQEKPAAGGKRIGQKQWWLRQMLAAVPPGEWCKAWSLEPQAILDLAGKTDHATLLREALAEAALRARDEAWAVALLHTAKSFDAQERDLFRLLAPPQREALAMESLKTLKVLDDKTGLPAAMLLQLCDHEWSERLAQQFLSALHEMVTKHDTVRAAWHLRSNLPSFALRIPPSVARAWKKPLPDNEWRNGLDEFFARLQFRDAMRKELASHS